jgi:threonine aldolase
VAWLAEGHWLDLAGAANGHAARLRRELASTDRVRIAWPCESNETFVVLERTVFDSLLAAGASMYEWYPAAMPDGVGLADDEVLVRLVTSFDSTDADIDALMAAVRSAPAG